MNKLGLFALLYHLLLWQVVVALLPLDNVAISVRHCDIAVVFAGL
jgi:hypothetical protein